MKVSVIVPVFNTEKYLHKCLDSLVSQTIQDIEIIVVNDGSNDNSQVIIDEYCRNYNNIRIFNKENGGLGSARNYGLQYCSGDFVGFVDSDDYVKEDMYEKMYNNAIENEADIVICDFIFITENDIESGSTCIKKLIDEDFLPEKQKCMKYGRTEAVNKLYSRDLFLKTSIRYPDILFEDYPVTILLIEAATHISYVDEPLYYYIQRKDSIMGRARTFSEKNFDILKGTEQIISSMQLNSNQSDFNFFIDEIAPVYAFTRFYRDIFFVKERKYRREFIKQWSSDLNRILPEWHKSKAISDLKQNLNNPVTKWLLDLIIYSFRTGNTFISDVFNFINRFIKWYPYEN